MYSVVSQKYCIHSTQCQKMSYTLLLREPTRSPCFSRSRMASSLLGTRAISAPPTPREPLAGPWGASGSWSTGVAFSHGRPLEFGLRCAPSGKRSWLTFHFDEPRLRLHGEDGPGGGARLARELRQRRLQAPGAPAHGERRRPPCIFFSVLLVLCDMLP